jgi:hypothetical protein
MWQLLFYPSLPIQREANGDHDLLGIGELMMNSEAILRLLKSKS